MDGRRISLDDPNIADIPVYALYGEAGAMPRQGWLHWETIPARSREHGFAIAPHRHEHLFQILHVTGGKGQVILDGARHELSAGTLVVVPAWVVHSYTFSTDIEGRVVTLMDRDVVEGGMDRPRPTVIPATGNDLVATLEGLMAESDHPETGHDLAMRAWLSLLLVALHRATALAAAPLSPARRHAEAFRRLVDGRFRDTRRIADYARALGISQTHLGRVCREVFGRSALSMVEARIGLEAQRLLIFSARPIKDIAVHLGYEDQAYFTRVMTRVLGQSPATIRRAARLTAVLPSQDDV